MARRKISPKTVASLEGWLTQNAVPEFQQIMGDQTILITCRLNKTADTIAPESAAMVMHLPSRAAPRQFRKLRARFIGSTHVSPIYTRCITFNGKRDYVHEIDYTQPDRLRVEKTKGAKSADTKSGINYRLFTLIIHNDHRVGTLTVGFPQAPSSESDKDRTKGLLLNFAQRNHRGFRDYLNKLPDIQPLQGPRF